MPFGRTSMPEPLQAAGRRTEHCRSRSHAHELRKETEDQYVAPPSAVVEADEPGPQSRRRRSPSLCRRSETQIAGSVLRLTADRRVVLCGSGATRPARSGQSVLSGRTPRDAGPDDLALTLATHRTPTMRSARASASAKTPKAGRCLMPRSYESRVLAPRVGTS